MSPIRALNTTYLVLGIAAAIIVIAVLRISVRKLGRRMPATAALTWRSYLKGQGTILFGFLLLGAVLSCASWALSVYWPSGKVSEGGQLIEFRQLNPREHPIYEDIDVHNYSTVIVMTKVIAPADGTATVTVYANQDGDKEIKHIPSVGATWSRWEHENSSKHLTLIVESAPSHADSAMQVDVLVYLSTK